MEGTHGAKRSGEEAVYAAGRTLAANRPGGSKMMRQPEGQSLPQKIKAAGGWKPSCCLPLFKLPAATLARRDRRGGSKRRPGEAGFEALDRK